ncbi:alpha/beta hydrolase [Gordonia soli]|uniref:Putative carboxylesterase n=1 Tax=Gordonia soli NBRC 108243 TaxID=1223545 RepID=M0QM39_9ACTN|nr:alpha/beta hydrolase [Gordonia soli]GAC69479.1 putative carboxylesterase [Gordonia soli NBRC 108243]
MPGCPPPTGAAPAVRRHRFALRRRRWSVTGATLVTALAVAGCATVPDSSPAATSGPSITERQTAAPVIPIEWKACGGTGDVDDPAIARRLQCGTLSVPVRQSDPSAGTFSVAVARLAAGGPTRRGSVVINPGGPGASGVDHLIGDAENLAGQTFAGEFDVVAFDPRGVGRSEPVVRCRTDAERDAERATDYGDRSPGGVARVEDHLRDVVAGCREHTPAALLTSVGTSHVVDDLEVLRAALGDERLTYVGFSYGSRIGLEYQRRHPDRVRALVSDGPVDPDADPIGASTAQAAAFQRVFDAFARDCATAPDCPLADRPAGALAAYHRLVRPLVTRPVPAGAGRVLTQADSETATSAALYQRSLWPVLRLALRRLADGDGTLLLALADRYEGRGDDGRYDNSQDAFTAIRCADDPRLPDRAAYDRLDGDLRRAAPYRDDGRGTGRGVLSICAFWPESGAGSPATVPSSSAPSDTARSNSAPPGNDPSNAGPAGGAVAGRGLMIATTDDPATPYATGRDLARSTDSVLVTVKGAGHTASLRGDACVDRVVNDYVVRLTLPPAALTC